MGTKYKSFYKKGDQLFNCYGRRTNRFLLLNYGFCLRHNKYNSLGFKVFVNFAGNKNKEKKEEEKGEGKDGEEEEKKKKEEEKSNMF